MANEKKQKTGTAAISSKQGKPSSKPKRQQPRKDSIDPRVNYDNARESKFEKDVQEERHSRKGYDKPMKGAKFGGKSTSNDVSWYAHTPEMLRAAASIPFTDVVGDKLPAGTLSFPGVMAIRWLPNIDGDAVNQSANSHYSFTVHANSRNYSYDAPDQMMMIMAGASLFSMIAIGIRAYGIMRRFNGLDKYTPNTLITAMGFDYDDLKTKLPQMWFDLNEIVSRSAQIWIPKDMPIIERWFWMGSHIYRDGDSSKSQYYLYVPQGYLTLSETGEKFGTSLTFSLWGGANTWSSYITKINAMFTALLNSQDRGIIFGDLLAAYGAERIYGISGIDSGYTVEPVYDREVLSQFENCVDNTNIVLNAVKQTTTGVIYSDWAGVQIAELTPAPYQAVLNFHQKDAPTPEQIMVATRMMTLGNKVAVASATEPSICPATAGTEIAVRKTVYSLNYSATGGAPAPVLRTVDTVLNGSLSWLVVQALIAFDWQPAITPQQDMVAVETMSPTVVNSVGSANPSLWLMDVDMFTWIDRLTLEKMHKTAIYSEFGVPTLL